MLVVAGNKRINVEGYPGVRLLYRSGERREVTRIQVRAASA